MWLHLQVFALHPSDNDLKLVRLLHNVPLHGHDSPFIESSQYFKNNIPKYGYILNIDDVGLYTEPVVPEAGGGLVAYYYDIKRKLVSRWKLIQAIAERLEKVDIYSIRNDKLEFEYLMMVPADCGIAVSTIVDWVVRYQMARFQEECWSDRIRYGVAIKFAKLGSDIWTC